jgi:quinol monooxygenase YgiN
MSVVVMLEFKCKDEAYEGFKQKMSDILPDTVKYEGCQALHAAADDENKSVVLYEVWDKIESQQKYMGWRQETGLMDELGPAVRAAPEQRIMNVLDF